MVSERGGLGISWDREIPPRYQDIARNRPPPFDEAPAYMSGSSLVSGQASTDYNTPISESFGIPIPSVVGVRCEAGNEEIIQGDAMMMMYGSRSLTPPPAIIRSGKYEYK